MPVESPESLAEPSPRNPPSGCVISPVAGALTAATGTLLLGRVWRACDIGTNAAANSFALVFTFAIMWVVATLWWIATVTILRRRSAVAALVCALLGSLALIWGLIAWRHDPGGYPAPQCGPGNVPPWWPGWLPL
jgi:hypothetical protein